MKLIEGTKYNTPYGVLTYYGKVGRFTCDSCNRIRNNTYEFIGNLEDYKKGYVGEWYHYGSECVKGLRATE